MKHAQKDLEYYENNKTCLYCKHNCNTERNLNVVCPHHFRGDCDSYFKNKFEWCDDYRKEVLDQLVIESSKNDNIADQISTVLAIGYYIATLLTIVILAFLSLRLRFGNPQLTETQLLIEFWHRYPELELLLIFLILLPHIIKWRSNR